MDGRPTAVKPVNRQLIKPHLHHTYRNSDNDIDHDSKRNFAITEAGLSQAFMMPQQRESIEMRHDSCIHVEHSRLASSSDRRAGWAVEVQPGRDDTQTPAEQCTARSRQRVDSAAQPHCQAPCPTTHIHTTHCTASTKN